MSDEFVYKGLPSSALGQSYDETMVIEETVEMEIESEPQTLEINDQQVCCGRKEKLQERI